MNLTLNGVRLMLRKHIEEMRPIVVWLCRKRPLSEGSPLTFPHLPRPNLNLFKQANMYLCGVLYGYDFKSHDQYGNGRILNCDREGRDLSSELPQFYVNVDFGFLPLTRELKKKKYTVGQSFPESTCSRAQKVFCGREANCHLPFSFRGKLWHEQQEEHCGGSDACGGDEITLCFAVQANLQLNLFIHLRFAQPCFVLQLKKNL